MMPISGFRFCSIVQILTEDKTENLCNLLLHMVFIAQLKNSLLHLPKDI